MTKIDKKKVVKLSLTFLIAVLLIFIVWCIQIFFTYKAFSNKRGANYNWSMMPPPFYNDEGSFEFVVKGESAKMRIWCENFTGKFNVRIINLDLNITLLDDEYRMCDENITFGSSGRYRLVYTVKNYTGGLYMGLDNISRLKNLANDNYKIIDKDEEKGFNWDYILYMPKEISSSNLLVIPNNTGTVDDDILVHRANAIGLAEWKSRLADDLGVPLLVPIFPRSESHADIYTHALDRNALITDIEDMKKLDMQLIAMIDDSRDYLKENDVELDEKILMWGFSASGDFVDRFTFLHPELVKAATLGGCDNMIPLKELNGENLPYPIGIYDYEDITGREFDKDAFESVSRYSYKGSNDKGGWQTITDGEKQTTYEWQDYYEKFIVPELKELSSEKPVPMYKKGALSDLEKDIIIYRAYDKKVLVDKFRTINIIFEDAGIRNNTFKVYDSIAHATNEETYSDELDFFKRALGN